MRRFTPPILGLLATALFFIPTRACMWDADTLAMERRRFPNTLELITGKFLRHSTAFYEWRAADREAKLAQEPNTLTHYDDLAVAYDKLGQHEKAIETILKKEAIQPGQYETYANLGTFHIHNGAYEEGLTWIEKAIEINPDAHFGREVYQKLLVEYVLLRREVKKDELKEGQKIPLPLYHEEHSMRRIEASGFAAFVLEKQGLDRATEIVTSDEIAKALKGVQGMMKFGNYESPVLLEALGDLLLFGYIDVDARRLATRAYIKASMAVEDPVVSAAYLDIADSVIRNHEGVTTQKVKAELEKELAEAQAWYAKVEADEAAWIAAGEDVDARFAAKYYEEPSLSGQWVPTEGVWRGYYLGPFLAIFLGAVGAVVLIKISRWLRRRIA